MRSPFLLVGIIQLISFNHSGDKMQVEYSIMDHFLQLLKFWWVIVILAVAGGVFGYEVSTVRTPVYESKGVITVGIDFVKSGQLTDVEEDQALNNATDIAGSSTVMKLVVEATQGKGIDLTLDELAKIGSVDRNGFQITLRVESPNSQKAYDIATIWVSKAEEVLNEALQQALKAESLNRIMTSEETCIQQATLINPSNPSCETFSQISLAKALAATENEYFDSKTKSLGLLSSLSFTISQEPQLPIIPRIYNRNILTLCGAIVGFIAGIVLVEGGFIGKWSRKDAKGR